MSFLKPEQMSKTQSMQYFSIVSKVCKEMETHLGFSDKDVAEFLIAKAMESVDSVVFNNKLKEFNSALEPAFAEQLYTTIRYLYPKVKETSGNSQKTKLVDENGVSGSVAKSDSRYTEDDEKKEKIDTKSSRSDSHRHHSHHRSPSRSHSHHRSHTSHRSRSRSRSSHRSHSHGHHSHSSRSSKTIKVNEIYDGRVVSIMEYGAFIEILGVYPPVQGLCHVSNISAERVRHPEDVLHRNQNVKVKIIKFDGQKIGLSMKDINQVTGEQMSPNPNDPIFSPPSTRPSRAKKRMTSQERFELEQMAASGVLSAAEQKQLLSNYAEEEEDSLTQPEEEVDVVVSEKIAPFLTGQNYQKVDKTATKIIKNPTGSLARGAIAGKEMMLERKKLREKQMEEERAKLPSTMMSSYDDPTPDGGIHLLASEIHSMAADSLTSSTPAVIPPKKPVAPSMASRSTLSIAKQRQSLPVFKYREKIIKAVKENTILILVGETGSGKTTQLTQYLVEAGVNGRLMVGCTQPRRVAATSVAKRVADEVGCRVGEEVGYSIRFDERCSSKTIIKYMTDGMLMREYLADGMLSKYSVLILDEAHERTLHTDVLFALLKELVKKRRDLKLIITSATLNEEKFSRYFDDAPIMKVEGRTFPVQIRYASEPVPNYLEACVDTAWDINAEEAPGDILVFLTGQEEIECACEMLEERQRQSTDEDIPPMIILSVFGAQTNEQQQQIFQPTPEGYRKVVFATNIAEASLTIDGIYFVIDSGYCKQSVFNPRAQMDSLVVTPISQDSANQRAGRAGRTGPGKCFRLYPLSAYENEMLPSSIPEIQRANLDNVVLQLKAMGINDLLNFDYMDPPAPQALINAMERLYTLDCLNDDGLLTPMGRKMAEFPLSPQLSKALLKSEELGCSSEVLTVVSMLTAENVYLRPKDKQTQADRQHSLLFQSEGDHITLLSIYDGWERNGRSKKWCDDKFIQERALIRAANNRAQIEKIMRRFDMRILENRDYQAIQKSILSGYFTNVAKRAQDGYKTLLEENTVHIHPSSSLKGREPEWVCYDLIKMTSREYMMNTMMINPKWLIEVAPKFYKRADTKTMMERRKNQKLEQMYNYRAPDDSWRLSKRKGQF